MVILEDVISKTKPSLTKSELDKYLRIKRQWLVNKYNNHAEESVSK